MATPPLETEFKSHVDTAQSSAPSIVGQERIESWSIGTVQLSRVTLPHPGVLTTLRMSAGHLCMLMQEGGVSALEHQGEKCFFDTGQWTCWSAHDAQGIHVHSHAAGTQLLVLEIPRESIVDHNGAALPEELQIVQYEDHALLQTVRDFAVARGWLDATWSVHIGTLLSRVTGCVIGEQHRARRAAASANAERLSRVRQFILRRLRDPHLSFDDIAERAGCSKRFVQMMFAGYGETVSQFILRNRLQQAHCELLSSSQDITDIAVANGFNDHSHFGRAYRRLFGITPGNVRRAYRVVRAQLTT